MKIFYISLGSFCHPKILLRDTNRQIVESLPFDFHSTPGTYSIYTILEKLYYEKKYEVEFEEILYTHQFNKDQKIELAVREKSDMFFLHFFEESDLLVTPEEYPVQISYINQDKIQSVKDKFNKRFQKLYHLMNDPENVLVFLRIENYANPVWDTDLEKLTNALSLFNNKNKFLIYSQINIDEEKDFFKTNTLNYNYKIPVMCVKKLYDESIQNVLKNDFLNILDSFESIINSCLILCIGNEKSKFYYDKTLNILFKLTDLHYWFKIDSMENNIMICSNFEKKYTFYLHDNIYELQ
tara:strand:+ start:1153 stop:2040 length:888 start_codon:yes stop_codon:yes gene_type:complete